MTPVVIPADGGDCFAMYAWAPGPAVLICPPFGDEALKTARIWRSLALRLGTHGLATLRFDLPGTGNSAGHLKDPDLVETWRSALRACVTWLEARHEGRVIVFGHRFGALLALDAIGSGIAAERLILLDPPASGAAWVRFLRARARLERTNSAPEEADLIQVAGMPLTNTALAAISAMPAPITGSACPPSLLVLNETQSAQNPWPDRLRQQGSVVNVIPFAGYEDVVGRDAFRTKMSDTVLDDITDDLVRSAGTLPASRPAPPTPRAELVLGGCTETPIFFGPAQALFGILCRPGIPIPSAPALLLPTTGMDPCSGMARMWTDLARRLARQGITSFRFDMSGVGESEGDLGHNPLAAVYHEDRVADLRAAVDLLMSLDFREVNVVAYCSGAYAAWHAAVPDFRISAILAGNLLYLNREPTLAAEILETRPGSSQIGQRSSLVAKLLPASGIAALRRLDDRIRKIIPRPIRNLLRGWERDPIQTRRHVKKLVARGCSVRLVMAHDDHGHLRLRRAFGETPRLPKGVELTVIEDADHQFSDRRHRAQFLDLAAEFALQTPAPTPAQNGLTQPTRTMEPVT